MCKNIEEISKLINNLEKKDKIKFSFFNSSTPLELLQVCFNETNDTIEMKFRDIYKDYMDRLYRQMPSSKL